jgi:hypothetical protein
MSIADWDIFFSSPQRGDRISGTLRHLSSGYHGIGTDHSPAYSADVKMRGTVPPLRHTSSCHGPRLIKRRENCSLILRIFK